MSVKLPELRRFISALSKDRNIALVPARSWGYSIYDATIIYPLDAITAWYRDKDDIVYDVGPEPKDRDVAERRIESIIYRLTDMLAEPIPQGMDRGIVRIALKHKLVASQVASIFWSLEHGRIEAKQRASSPNFVALGGFPAYGEGYRDYGSTPKFNEQCYGVLANPAATCHDQALAMALAPLHDAPTREDLWARFQQQLATIATLVPPPEPSTPSMALLMPILLTAAGGTLTMVTDTGAPDPQADVQPPQPEAEEEAKRPDQDSLDELPYEKDGSGEKGFGTSDPVQEAFYANANQVDVNYYLSLLNPTIRKFLDAMAAIAGKARCERQVLVGQSSGVIDPRRMAGFVASKDMNIFRKPIYRARQSRLSVAFLIDDSGSMGSLSAARFPGAINVAYPRLSDIQSARFLALGLASAVQQIGGTTWISTINHLAIDEWGPADHKKALGRIVATGGSQPDKALQGILAKISELPAPRMIVFITDGEVQFSDTLVDTRTTRLISVVPPSFTGGNLYGSPTIPLDDQFFENFTKVLRNSSTQLAARS